MVRLLIKERDASAFFFASIRVDLAAAWRSSLDSSPEAVFSGCVALGEKMLGVDRILSKCWNYYLAFRRSESLTTDPLISVTFGKR